MSDDKLKKDIFEKYGPFQRIKELPDVFLGQGRDKILEACARSNVYFRGQLKSVYAAKRLCFNLGGGLTRLDRHAIPLKSLCKSGLIPSDEMEKADLLPYGASHIRKEGQASYVVFPQDRADAIQFLEKATSEKCPPDRLEEINKRSEFEVSQMFTICAAQGLSEDDIKLLNQDSVFKHAFIKACKTETNIGAMNNEDKPLFTIEAAEGYKHKFEEYKVAGVKKLMARISINLVENGHYLSALQRNNIAIPEALIS